MRMLLGFVAFCSLIGPLEGFSKGSSPGVLFVVSPETFSKYFSDILLRNRLIQSYFQAIHFPPDSPPKGKELGHSIQGLHFMKVFLPIISVELKPNSTGQLSLKVRLLLSAQYHFSHFFERFDVSLDVHFVADFRFQNYSLGIIRIKYETCETQLRIAQIISPSYLIKERVRPLVLDLIAATFPGALCREVEAASNVALYDFLYTTNVLLSIRSATTIQYQLATLPQITPSYLAIKLHIYIRMARRFVTIPLSDHPVTFPALRGHSLCLAFTQDAINAVLTMTIRVPAQEFITTPQAFSGSFQLIDAVAALLSYQKCPKCPEKSPLKILIRVIEAATIILQPNNSHFQTALEIAVAAKDTHGGITELFVIKANLRLSAEMSVHDNRLIFVTTLSKLELLVISSEIGHVSVTSLTKWFRLLLVETFVPRFNDALDGGIPVPSFLNIKVDYPKFYISQGLLTLCL